MAAPSVKVSVEAVMEHQIQEVTLDGQEIYVQSVWFIWFTFVSFLFIILKRNQFYQLHSGDTVYPRRLLVLWSDCWCLCQSWLDTFTMIDLHPLQRDSIISVHFWVKIAANVGYLAFLLHYFECSTTAHRLYFSETKTKIKLFSAASFTVMLPVNYILYLALYKTF